jgi:N-acetylmuramoyl-L-alanine amidase
MTVRPIAPTHIIIHHSATADSGTVSWGAIEEYHTKTQGWADIGYHAGVELVNGKAYALIGRGLQYVAAATKESNMNTNGLHVCVVGDFDKVAPSEAVLKVLAERVVGPWMKQFKIPVANVKGHRDYTPSKTCPGTKFSLENFRKRLGG